MGPALTRNHIPQIDGCVPATCSFHTRMPSQHLKLLDYHISVYIHAHLPYPMTQLSSSSVTRLLRVILGSTSKSPLESKHPAAGQGNTANCLSHTVGSFHAQLCKPGGISDAHINEHRNQLLQDIDMSFQFPHTRKEQPVNDIIYFAVVFCLMPQSRPQSLLCTISSISSAVCSAGQLLRALIHHTQTRHERHGG